MGVRVVEHEVVSEHPGKVAVTMPADGEPVRDTDDGIHIGVGITGDGIPVEIAGMDKDEAKTKLQQQASTSRSSRVSPAERISARLSEPIPASACGPARPT